MKILAYENKEKECIKELKNDCKSIQKFVNGFFEIVPISQNLVVVCNEEGRILDFSATAKIKLNNNDIVIFGNFFVCSFIQRK